MLADVATHVHEWWGPVLAFAAGVVSFASPCVLPLVPGYLSFVTAGRGELTGGRQPILPIVLFIMGGVFVVDGGQTLKGMTGPHELRAFRRERKR